MQRLIEATHNSLRGVLAAFGSEAAFRQELAALVVALPLGFFIAPSVAWFVAMIGVVLFVLVVELLNTSIEKLSDHVTPDQHPAIGRVKDIGSAAVFFSLVLTGLVWLAALAARFGLI